MKNHFTPDPRYLTKLRLVSALIALLIWIGMGLIAWAISFDEEIGRRGAEITMLVVSGLNLLWLVPTLLVSGPYYRSLQYELEDDEAIVRVGILTNSVKHVPYRTVTNITVKRDPFDRWLFGLGSLIIQTAGMSGTSGAEESLVGLGNVDEIYEQVATELRRFRRGLDPTASEEEGVRIEAARQADGPTLEAILGEVQAIRLALESEG
jgi:membrane protein YdbS with pleckstrin-like domain